MEELLQQILVGQKQLFERVNSIEVNMNNKFVEVNQSLARIEQEQGTKVSALFDARELQFDANERISETLFRIDEKVNRIESKLDRLSFKVSAHDMQLKQAK